METTLKTAIKTAKKTLRLLLIFLFMAACGVPGRPRPPLDRETIGHGFPKTMDSHGPGSKGKPTVNDRSLDKKNFVAPADNGADGDTDSPTKSDTESETENY